MCDTTRPVGATLTWEQYCYQMGVDPHQARGASVTSALCALLTRCDMRLQAPKVPTFDAEPGEPTT